MARCLALEPSLEPGGQGHLIQFHDSGDVYRFDAQAADLAMPLVAGQAGGPGVITARGLGGFSDTIRIYNHLDFGFVYHFTQAGTPGDVEAILYDPNRDGQLEGLLALGGGSGDGAILSDSRKWLGLPGD